MTPPDGADAPIITDSGFEDRLKAEAAIDPDLPDVVHAEAVTKDTQIIAIYGKGGIGKSRSRWPISAI